MTQNALVSLVHSSIPEYRQASNAQFRVAHALRSRIIAYLNESVRRQIDSLRAAKKTIEAERYSIWLDADLGEQTFPRWKTATIVRQWIWETYHGKVGLDAYEANKVGRWTICIVY